MGKKSASGAGQPPNIPPGTTHGATTGGGTIAPIPAPLEHAHGHHAHIEIKFLEELKKRNVVRVAFLYLVVCWLILEPIHVVFHMLEVPLWANQLVLVLMAVGFPAVLLFAWAFEITPEGLKPTVEVDPKRSIRPLTGRRLDRAIMVVMALAITYFVADKFWLAKRLPVAASEQAAAQGAAVTHATTPPAVASDKSIAVLPFVDMSEKKDQEYFSDGLSEELIDRLSHSPDLKVIARTSSFQFKGKSEDMRSIASRLGVANLLEGSVRKAGNELRVTAQLIRAGDGTHLWSQTYDRKLSDVFKVQDEIAGTVATALNTALRSVATPYSEGKAPNQEAYNQVLLGNYFYSRGAEKDDQRAVTAYTQATKIDPNYALAWAKLATATATGTATPERHANARAALQRSLSLDPNLVYAHLELGRQLYYEWDWGGAKAEFQRAIELDSNYLLARVWLLWLTEGILGRFDRNIGYLRQLVSSDPLDAEPLYYLAANLEDADQFDAAAATWQKLLQLSPAYEGGHEGYAEVVLLAGRPQEALEALREEADELSKLEGLAIVYWKLGEKLKSDAALTKLKERQADGAPAGSAYSIAEVHAYRGESDAAFEWLERSYDLKAAGMTIILVDPLLRSLHGNPRFDAMVHKLKLDDWKRQVSAGLAK
jgi:adenylate cyclase